MAGVGKMSKMVNFDGDQINDQYGMNNEVNVFADNDEDDVAQQKSGFLNVYKENQDQNVVENDENISSEIKYK